MFRFLILGIMRGGGAFHGYALMRAYRERSGTKLSSTSFYRQLQRLAGAGLVQPAAKGDGVDRRRAPYRIKSSRPGSTTRA
jgi:DNA-binding PadR family transcriptional regulator